ncbi:hypothetical protein ACWNXI_01810 [Caldibacillus thermoamylovorans]
MFVFVLPVMGEQAAPGPYSPHDERLSSLRRPVKKRLSHTNQRHFHSEKFHGQRFALHPGMKIRASSVFSRKRKLILQGFSN